MSPSHFSGGAELSGGLLGNNMTGASFLSKNMSGPSFQDGMPSWGWGRIVRQGEAAPWSSGIALDPISAATLLVLATVGFVHLLYMLFFVVLQYVMLRPWDGSVRDHTGWVSHAPFAVAYIALSTRSFWLWATSLIPAPMRVLEISSAFVQSQVLFALVNLGIPDALAAAGPSTAKQLAKTTGVANARWLERVLRAASAVSLLRAREVKVRAEPGAPAPKKGATETVYSLTGLTSCLRSTDPTMVSSLIKLNEYNYATLGHLSQALVSGTSPQELRSGKIFWEELSEEPERAATFDAAMTGTFECLGCPAVIAGYNWSKYGTVVDVAGGTGGFLRPLLRQYPRMQGVLVDQKDQITRAKGLWAADYSDLLSRVTFVPGDVFQGETVPPPPFQGSKDKVAYMMKDILHNWGDEASIKMLKNVATAIKRAEAGTATSGRVSLLIVETSVMRSPMPQLFQPRTTGDIIMLSNFGDGCERTKAEFEGLFEAAGFRLKRVVPTKSMLLVLEAVPL